MRIRRLLSTWRALTDQTASSGHSAAHTGTACSIRSAHSAIGSACGGDDDDGDDEDDNDEPDNDEEEEETDDDEVEEVDADAGAGDGARNGGVRAAARSSGDDAVNALSSSLPLLVSVLVTAVSDGSMRTNVYSTRSRHAIAITRCCERKRKNERIKV